MKKLKILSVFCVAFLVCGFFAQPAQAILGDVNGDTWINVFDVVYLLGYLFQNGPPPPNPIDADVDGSPGINLGDVLHLTGYLFLGCELLPYTGASIEIGSQIRFSSTLIPRDSIVGTPFTVPVTMIENVGPDLTGMVIPISYTNKSNEVEVTLDNVTFTGGIIPLDWEKGFRMDNPNKRVVFYAYGQWNSAPIDSGITGMVAQLHFTRLSLGPKPLVMSTTQVPPSHSFILMSAYCADTTGGTSPSKRIFTPKLSLALMGDCDGNGKLDAADVVYLSNYLYTKGPPPNGL